VNAGPRESPQLQESTAPLRKAPLEQRAVRRFAVHGQYELDRQVEQRTEPSEGWFVLSLADVVWTRTGLA
jgi:hypothetical protein